MLAGMVAFAAVLPPSLSRLDFMMVGCGNDGMIAVAAALPSLLRLTDLDCGHNPRIGDAGFSAFAGALPQLPELGFVCASGSTSLGLEGALAIAAALRPAVAAAAGGAAAPAAPAAAPAPAAVAPAAQCLKLSHFELDGCSAIPDSGRQALQSAWEAHVSAARPSPLDACDAAIGGL